MDSALHAHLVRLAVFGGLSLALGIALGKRPFGIMTAAWGAVDLLFAMPGLVHPTPVEPQGFRAFLAFNLGLDLGYVGVGTAMALLAGERLRIRGFGQAIIVQGGFLFALDAWLWFR